MLTHLSFDVSLAMMPQWVILFSGKRKSGKDFITDRLHQILGNESCAILKISHPIKSHWAKTLRLNLDELLGDGEYKEKYRLEMIKWSEEMRDKDYGCFCKLACDEAPPRKIWIVSDVRRKTDVEWFKQTYGDRVKTVRIEAEETTRISRGWIFVHRVDDAPSECNLDDFTDWDYVIDNNDDPNVDIEEKIQPLLELLL